MININIYTYIYRERETHSSINWWPFFIPASWKSHLLQNVFCLGWGADSERLYFRPSQRRTATQTDGVSIFAVNNWITTAALVSITNPKKKRVDMPLLKTSRPYRIIGVNSNECPISYIQRLKCQNKCYTYDLCISISHSI